MPSRTYQSRQQMSSSQALRSFPEANEIRSPSMSDDDQDPKGPSTSTDPKPADVDAWSGDVTDEPHFIFPAPDNTPSNGRPGPSARMQDIIREMRGPLRPHPNLSTSSVADRLAQSIGSRSASTDARSSLSQEGYLVKQLDSHLKENAEEDGPLYPSRMTKLQQSDRLIDRLASELRGQHAELHLLTQAMHRKKERLQGFFDDIITEARTNPDGLLTEIQDWKKVFDEFDWIEQVNDRSHEVESLLAEVRDRKE